MINKIILSCIFFLVFTANNLSSATISDTVTLSKDYKYQVWYNLITGTVAESDNNTWDLAFETGQRGGIHVNGAKGIRAWVVPNKTREDFGSFSAKDTAGMAESWEFHTNSEETWSIGALNLGLDGFETGGDFGWGEYDLSTHSIVGTKLFVIKVNNSTYKKFYIEALAAQEYSFVFANLDGSDESIGTIDKKDFVDLNFGYYSFETISSIDREPVANEWHLTFGKYEILIPTGPGTFLPYPVVGVRQNRGVRVAKLTGVDPETVKYPEWDELNYFLKITTIGSDWKTFNNTTFEYTIPKDLVYFISYDSLANLQAKIFRLYFTGYEGTGTGKIAFQKEQLQTSVIEQDGFKIADFAIYPNLISIGESFNLAIDSKINQVATIDIMSVDGTVLLSQQFSLDPTLNSLNLLPKGLASGMYFVKININGNCGIEKLIVQ